MRTSPSPFSLPPIATAPAANPADSGASDSDLCDPEDELGRSKNCSSGLGCIRVKGNSATSSLNSELAMLYLPLNSEICTFLFTDPPREPRNSLILTLYWTRIPRFSFCALSVTLKIHKESHNIDEVYHIKPYTIYSTNAFDQETSLYQLTMSTKPNWCPRV